jgi:hypothetical protein
MNLNNVSTFDDRRCSARDVAKILAELPITVVGKGLKLRARMGLGRIIYISPDKGKIGDVEKGEGVTIIRWNPGEHFYCEYGGQKFGIHFGYSLA